MIKSWSRKTAIDVKYTPQTKGERWEREREKKKPVQIICTCSQPLLQLLTTSYHPCLFERVSVKGRQPMGRISIIICITTISTLPLRPQDGRTSEDPWWVASLSISMRNYKLLLYLNCGIEIKYSIIIQYNMWPSSHKIGRVLPNIKIYRHSLYCEGGSLAQYVERRTLDLKV